jgi:hypothetical protein
MPVHAAASCGGVCSVSMGPIRMVAPCQHVITRVSMRTCIGEHRRQLGLREDLNFGSTQDLGAAAEECGYYAAEYVAASTAGPTADFSGGGRSTKQHGS